MDAQTSGIAMSEDINQRIREKTVQIASLNQKVDALQAQLNGSQKRANQLGSQVAGLEASLAERDSQIRMLESQLAKTKGALETVGKEMQGIKSEQIQILAKKQPQSENSSLKENLALAEMNIEKLTEDLRSVSQAATSVLNQEDGAYEKLRQVLLESGDPKYRILSMVQNRKAVLLEEVASSLGLDMMQAQDYIEALQAEGEVEIRDSHTIRQAAKYREVIMPRDEWLQLDPSEVFERLEAFLQKTDDSRNIVLAIETVVEVLEQKLARGGALIFQMRRTADSWKKHSGSVEELQYMIREWNARAQALG